MTIQIIHLNYSDTFKRFSEKYDIFRDLYESDLLGLEIRNCEWVISEKIRNIVLSAKEICYLTNDNKEGLGNLLILGNVSIFKELSRKILASGNEDIGYRISTVIKNYSDYYKKEFIISEQRYSYSNSYVMGILNITPDSFSDGGQFSNCGAAVNHAFEMIDQGADFIDIGAESTRPEAEVVSVDEELRRVLPVIEEIISKRPDAVLSIDTTKSEVAREALKRGVKIVNDISGLTFDPRMAEVISSYKATLVLMHIKGTPRNMQDNPSYEDVVTEVYDFLQKQINKANEAGIKDLIIDPGIGFGKRVFDNYELLKRLDEFKGFGLPILVGLSRKSFIGKAFHLEVSEREDLTLVAETIAIKNSARIIRTHEIINTKQASKLCGYVENPGWLMNV